MFSCVGGCGKVCRKIRSGFWYRISAAGPYKIRRCRMGGSDELCARISNAAGATAAGLEPRPLTRTDSARTSANIKDLLLATPLSDGIYMSGVLSALPTSRQQSGPFSWDIMGATVMFSDSWVRNVKYNVGSNAQTTLMRTPYVVSLAKTCFFPTTNLRQ